MINLMHAAGKFSKNNGISWRGNLGLNGDKRDMDLKGGLSNLSYYIHIFFLCTTLLGLSTVSFLEEI